MSKKFLSGINVTGTATLNSVANAGGNTNKFLVLESDGSVKYRTSSETAGDIGAVPTGRQLTINGITYDLSQNRAWTISTGSILNSRTVTEFTATAGQTTFNLTYNPNGLEVFYNGSNLDSTEYTASNGTSIVLTNACNVGDVVKVISLIDGVTVSGVTPISFNSANGQISIQQSSGSQAGYLSSTDWTTFNNKVSTSRTLTINGTTYDLSANRSWSIAPGGTAGQILSKNSATDYDWSWIENFAEKLQHVVKLGEAITKGQAVYVAPSGDNNSTNMTVMKASNATEATSSKTMGLVESSGVLNDFVRVITEGLLTGLDTSTANQGDPVWLGTNGNLIFGLANKPTAPAHLVFIGIVTRVNQNNGEIFVKVQNGFELKELHDISIASEANNQALVYESSTGLWKNKTLSTSWITEGTNLYYTDARVGSYLTTNSYATQTYVTTQIANLVNSAPTTLDTLNELATALGNDPNFATTIATSLGGKEPTITAGTTTQYWRGDKTWQTLPVYTLSGLGGVPTSRTITINGVAYDLSADISWSIAAGVTSFNTRTGAITLSSSDVTTALGYTPYNGTTNPNGYITGVTNITGYAAMLNTSDTRTISPSSHTAYRLSFGFTSWNNNNSPDWADYLHLRSYGDSSGGADNLIMFKKNGIGMRIWQQAFGSSTNYSSYVDVIHSGNYTSYNSFSSLSTSGTLTFAGADRAFECSVSGGISFYSNEINAGAQGGTGDLYIGWRRTNSINLGVTTYLSNTKTMILGWDDTMDRTVAGGASRTRLQLAPPSHTGAEWTFVTYDDSSNAYLRIGYGNSSSSLQLRHDGTLWVNGTLYTSNISANGYFQNGSVWMNNGADYNSYNENIRLFNAPNGVSVIGFSCTGTAGQPTTSVLGYSDRFEIRYSSSWQERIYNGYCEASGSYRAPVFYDSNDTTYFFDGNGQTRAYRMNLSDGQVQAANAAGGRLRISSWTNGESEINGNCHNVVLGPYSTRTGAGLYYAGIAINGLMNYGGGIGYDVAPHIWIGGYYRDTPGSERSDFIIAIKSGTGTSGTGADLPQVRVRVDYGGNLTATGDITAYSDARVKENIVTVNNAIDTVQKLRGVYYNRTDIEDKKRRIGVIAQETELVLPEVVNKDATGMYNVSYGNIAGLFIEAIKELKQENDELRSILKRNNIN